MVGQDQTGTAIKMLQDLLRDIDETAMQQP
jgi:hypothetical protein